MPPQRTSKKRKPDDLDQMVAAFTRDDPRFPAKLKAAEARRKLLAASAKAEVVEVVRRVAPKGAA